METIPTRVPTEMTRRAALKGDDNAADIIATFAAQAEHKRQHIYKIVEVMAEERIAPAEFPGFNMSNPKDVRFVLSLAEQFISILTTAPSEILGRIAEEHQAIHYAREGAA